MESEFSIIEFIKKTNDAKNIEELFMLLGGVFYSLGYDRFVYSVLTDYLAIDELRNHDDGFKLYMEEGYLHVDPVVRYVKQYECPVFWDSVKKTRCLTTAKKKILSEGKKTGLLEGVGIPIHGPRGLVGFGLASRSSVGMMDKNKLSLLAAIGQQFHLAYCGLQKNSDLRTLPSLTKREREVLMWCATGKSNWEIAKILSISVHGTEFHVRNIFKKLEVNSRVAAVVKGLRFGLANEHSGTMFSTSW